MTLIRDAGRPLAGKRVALVFGPGNVAIDYAAALVRGPERALLELGASVDTFNFAHYLDAIVAYAKDYPPHGLRYPEGSPLRTTTIARLDTGEARELLGQAKQLADGADLAKLAGVACQTTARTHR